MLGRNRKCIPQKAPSLSGVWFSSHCGFNSVGLTIMFYRNTVWGIPWKHYHGIHTVKLCRWFMTLPCGSSILLWYSRTKLTCLEPQPSQPSNAVVLYVSSSTFLTNSVLRSAVMEVFYILLTVFYLVEHYSINLCKKWLSRAPE